MKLLQKLFDFYLDSSIHIGLSVYALTYMTLIFFSLPYDEAVLYFTFYGTIVTYNFIKYGSSARKYFFVANNYLQLIQILSFVCFALAVYYAFQLQVKTVIVAVILSLFSSLYIIPFLPNQKNFRTLPGFKITVVALCWTGVSVLLPLINADFSFSGLEIILLSLQRFILILILMIPFEISDLAYDEEELGTLPQRIGVLFTKQLSYSWIVVFIALELLLQPSLNAFFFSTVIVSVLLVGSIYFSGTKKSKYFTSFWVESIPIVWCILYVLAA